MQLARNFLVVLSILIVFSTSHTFAKMNYRDGVVLNRQIPSPVISSKIVRLDVPHIRQKTNLCVPTSSAMILKYYGTKHDPVSLKELAEGYKPKSRRNKTFTYWKDMRHALKKVGKNWPIKVYGKTARGFNRGLGDIKNSLRGGRPVMIDVHLGGGHTFVVMGFNDIEKVVYIRDPDISGLKSRILTYKQLQTSWHNHKFGNSRSVFFSRK